MMRLKVTMAALLAMTALGTTGATADPRPVVVELFTSQGCSSCPPADAFLSDLARTRADVLPLAFHVTYWNSLGWRDPYSMDAATERQKHYAATMGVSSIYTPQMVVDGKTDVVGSDRQAGIEAIRGAAKVRADAPVTLARDAEGVAITLGAGQGAGTVWLVGYDKEHRTAVGRGENGGRTLVESNIVRGMVKAGDWQGNPIVLHATSPAGEQTAVLVQAADGRILGAARLGG